jgi:hypothetical protein
VDSFGDRFLLLASFPLITLITSTLFALLLLRVGAVPYVPSGSAICVLQHTPFPGKLMIHLRNMLSPLLLFVLLLL